MWWPQLEEKVRSILGSHGDAESSPTRSDRELLEEILELSRMQARPAPGRPQLPRHTVHELLDAIEEVLYTSEKYGDKSRFVLHDKLRRPIKRLTLELDNPELYHRFIFMRRGMTPEESHLPTQSLGKEDSGKA